MGQSVLRNSALMAPLHGRRSAPLICLRSRMSIHERSSGRALTPRNIVMDQSSAREKACEGVMWSNPL
jgi:hypothetical protein